MFVRLALYTAVQVFLLCGTVCAAMVVGITTYLAEKQSSVPNAVAIFFSMASAIAVYFACAAGSDKAMLFVRKHLFTDY